MYRVEGVRMTSKYGINTVRMPARVPAGAKLRATSRLAEVTQLDAAVQAGLSTTVEIEGKGKPACVVEFIVRYVV